MMRHGYDPKNGFSGNELDFNGQVDCDKTCASIHGAKIGIRWMSKNQQTGPSNLCKEQLLLDLYQEDSDPANNCPGEQLLQDCYNGGCRDSRNDLGKCIFLFLRNLLDFH